MYIFIFFFFVNIVFSKDIRQINHNINLIENDIEKITTSYPIKNNNLKNVNKEIIIMESEIHKDIAVNSTKNNLKNVNKEVQKNSTITESLDLNENDILEQQILLDEEKAISELRNKERRIQVMRKKVIENKQPPRKLTQEEYEAKMLEEEDKQAKINELAELQKTKEKLEIEKLRREIDLMEVAETVQRRDAELKRLETIERYGRGFGSGFGF